MVAGAVLELGGVATDGDRMRLALETLRDGRAWHRFERICTAQGGLREPPRAAHVRPLAAECSGRIVHIDNRKLSRLAKLAGAPERKAAGVHLQLRLGDVVSQGQTLMELHAQTPGEMAYALQYAVDARQIVHIEA